MKNIGGGTFRSGALALGATALEKKAIAQNPNWPLVAEPSRALPAAATNHFAHSARALESHIDVLIKEPIASINPDIYGHFAEHLGGVIYDGVWVGEKSKVPNTNGIRNALVEARKRIKPSVIRWPGGWF